MSPRSDTEVLHPDLRVVHSIPGRIRLRARKIHGQPKSAEALMRKLSVITGLQNVEANPTTGSITMHYAQSALESVEFFAELAAALGLIAEGLDADGVEALLKVAGTAPGIAKTLDERNVFPALAMFAAGFFAGRHFA